MAFQDRTEAAQMLARRLDKFRGQHPLVLAIPRGAVPMGQIVAEALDGELDVVLVRKLRAPQNPELAIGSIDETGAVYLDRDTRDLWDELYLEEEKKVQLETIQRRRRMYQPMGSAIDATGRVVIVLDDGIATGSTMIAALRAVRSRHPSKLVAATGVASLETLGRIRREADEVVCLETPERSCTPLGITSATSLKCRMKTSSRLSRTRDGQAYRTVRAADVHDRARRRVEEEAMIDLTQDAIRVLLDHPKGEGMIVSCYADTSVTEGFVSLWSQHLKNEASAIEQRLAPDHQARAHFAR